MPFLSLERERTFKAKTEMVPEIVGWIEEAAEDAGLHPRQQQHLALSTEEAVMNICSYAYEIPPGEVTIQIFVSPEQCRVLFRDKGVPFDPFSLEEPDLQASMEEREIGGLGILLMRRVMDEVHYTREGDENLLRLVVYCRE
ncbi:MAG TPA: ATP-binding protein [Synergistaceae bacterium]|nr:ATP-binding protein [Synergistaceae bacterium]HPJ25384.1 ATP-binding protein [Synergistaceae bacterium]HPQ37167.1 ATP-binding protein [Synergistaceae bacterium]